MRGLWPRPSGVAGLTRNGARLGPGWARERRVEE